MNLIPVIMAGGSGTRLWPLSRSLFPKQFLNLVDHNSMLQNTLIRMDGLTPESPILICNEEHRFLAAGQMQSLGIKSSTIILEPQGRNTAPAIALAALEAGAVDPKALLLVLAADHVIQDVQAFQEVVQKALPAAEQGALVTFGITPSSPKTSYGYILCGEAHLAGYKISRFEEKPTEERAQSFLDQGGYLWNSGMFLFQAQVYLDALGQWAPDILSPCEKAHRGRIKDLDFLRVDRESFLSCPSNSIDYAIMEKTDQGLIFPLDAGWDDLGSWTSLGELREKDPQGNSLRGDTLVLESKGNLIDSEDRLTAAIGVEDLIIVSTTDALLVAHKDRAQEVKDVVQKLKAQGREESENQITVYRPWGTYKVIDLGERFKVKRITVNPGAKLSLQKHYHRAEHWVVVSGTARVIRGEETLELSENQSTYIPLGEVHALENPGLIPLEMIEVQSGSYVGEDDIQRLEDLYGRI